VSLRAANQIFMACSQKMYSSVVCIIEKESRHLPRSIMGIDCVTAIPALVLAPSINKERQKVHKEGSQPHNIDSSIRPTNRPTDQQDTVDAVMSFSPRVHCWPCVTILCIRHAVNAKRELKFCSAFNYLLLCILCRLWKPHIIMLHPVHLLVFNNYFQ
jgi:hypothetical protein